MNKLIIIATIVGICGLNVLPLNAAFTQSAGVGYAQPIESPSTILDRELQLLLEKASLLKRLRLYKDSFPRPSHDSLLAEIAEASFSEEIKEALRSELGLVGPVGFNSESFGSLSTDRCSLPEASVACSDRAIQRFSMGCLESYAKPVADLIDELVLKDKNNRGDSCSAVRLYREIGNILRYRDLANGFARRYLLSEDGENLARRLGRDILKKIQSNGYRLDFIEFAKAGDSPQLVNEVFKLEGIRQEGLVDRVFCAIVDCQYDTWSKPVHACYIKLIGCLIGCLGVAQRISLVQKVNEATLKWACDWLKITIKSCLSEKSLVKPENDLSDAQLRTIHAIDVLAVHSYIFRGNRYLPCTIEGYLKRPHTDLMDILDKAFFIKNIMDSHCVSLQDQDLWFAVRLELSCAIK